ncbi:MAG: hypothetical protein V4482_02180 [Pseudomonadota bacterium]
MSKTLDQSTTHRKQRDDSGISTISVTLTKENTLTEEIVHNLTQQIYLAMPEIKNDDENKKQSRQKAIAHMIVNLDPQDELERMLTVQMLAIHHASLDCLSVSFVTGNYSDPRYQNLNQVNKLMRTFAVLMDSLGRYRDRGRSQLSVGHVDVHSGGQAIVGNIHVGAFNNE